MVVTVIGTGYVGLVTGACLAANGHTIRCVDVSQERVSLIQAGKAPFYEPGLEELLRAGLASGRLSVTTGLRHAMQGSELSLIAVGTPSQENGEPDLSYLETAAGQIGAELRGDSGYHVVAVKSTVIPGTTRNLVRHAVERTSGLKLGQFGLCMNPEFLREGSAVDDFMQPDRIVIGQLDSRSGDVVQALYQPFTCAKLRVSIEEAELTKYASNSLLSVLISFSNELAALCEATPGADVGTVMDGLYLDRRMQVTNGATSPEILSYLRAGIGFGGSCLPKDVSALRVYGKRTGVPTPMLDSVLTTNANRPMRVVEMAEAALDGLSQKTVALLGLAFKPGTDDLRSSPAIPILNALRAAGARVQAYDPCVSPEAALGAGLKGFFCKNLESAVRDADAVLITTADPAFRSADWTSLTAAMHTPILIDGRNVLRHVALPEAARYYPIGVGGTSNRYATASR